MKEPKEKAEELATKMFNLQPNTPCNWRVAIKCAIIAVDEIMNAFSLYKGMHDQEFIDADIVYYNSVKEELNKMLK